jgi:hypothetical protein
VNRGFQFEILFSESDWHLGPFWSRCWTVIDDGVHRPEIIVSLLLSFEFHGVSNLILVLTNSRVVVVRFPELAMVTELIGLPATEGKIAEMVAMMIVVVEIVVLRLDLVESS